jgi:hypothetical protein
MCRQLKHVSASCENFCYVQIAFVLIIRTNSAFSLSKKFLRTLTLLARLIGVCFLVLVVVRENLVKICVFGKSWTP